MPDRRFAFRLALALGEPDVDEMLESISLPLVHEWAAYAEIEPFGEERADLRSGIIASVIANVVKGKGGRTLTPRDFMPQFDKPVRRQTVQQMQSVFSAFAAVHNQRVAEQRKHNGT